MVTRVNEIKFIDEVVLEKKRVFIRCDFNIPIKNGVITDDTRIVAALKTIEYAIEQGAKVTLGSHLGRPKGGKFEEEYSMKPVGEALAKYLKKDVLLTDMPDSDALGKMIEDLKSNQIILLENLRFVKFEKDNDTVYAKKMASHFDVYVNDAFGTAHRAEVSTEGIAHHVKEAVAGFLIKTELEKFNKMLDDYEKPFIAILGGAKVSDKIGVINELMNRVDKIIIGGAMANTFLAAKGYSLGKSKIESDKIELAKEILANAERKGIDIMLPEDLLGATEFSNDAEHDVFTLEAFPEDMMALDIGEKTAEKYSKTILKAKTVFWNGPMGVFEMENFAKGTLKVAVAVTTSRSYSVIGGGDSVAAIKSLNLENKIDHVSTGGGASLEYLEGQDLPALAALRTRKNG